MKHQQEKKDTKPVIVREKRTEIMRLAQQMTSEQRKLLIAALERRAK